MPLASLGTNAPRIFREAFFCVCMVLSSACDAKESTPDWQTQTPQKQPKQALSYAKPPKNKKRITFMVYNVRNYFDTHHPQGNGLAQPKPEQEIRDLVHNIVTVNPDILGICEIGDQRDLDDLRQRLNQRGCRLKHTYLHGGSDQKRRQAILSRFPIHPHIYAQLTYRYHGKQQKILRGILDVTIPLPSGDVRFLGVHLKSKRPHKYLDQARVRRSEAALLRSHANTILQKNAQAKVIVFGDFNDTKQSPAIRAITGNTRSHTYLRPLDLRASNGSKWTHYWSFQDVYSRFDYVFVSKAMLRFIDTKKSFIYEPPKGNNASDHRPLIISIR